MESKKMKKWSGFIIFLCCVLITAFAIDNQMKVLATVSLMFVICPIYLFADFKSIMKSQNTKKVNK